MRLVKKSAVVIMSIFAVGITPISVLAAGQRMPIETLFESYRVPVGQHGKVLELGRPQGLQVIDRQGDYVVVKFWSPKQACTVLAVLERKPSTWRVDTVITEQEPDLPKKSWQYLPGGIRSWLQLTSVQWYNGVRNAPPMEASSRHAESSVITMTTLMNLKPIEREEFFMGLEQSRVSVKGTISKVFMNSAGSYTYYLDVGATRDTMIYAWGTIPRNLAVQLDVGQTVVAHGTVRAAESYRRGTRTGWAIILDGTVF